MERHTSAPEIITAADIVAKLREGVNATYDIELRAMKIPMRVLSCDEFNKIRHGAIAKVSLIKHGDDTDKNLEIQKGVLAYASTIVPGVPGIFTEKVLTELSLDEITYLYDQYISVLERVNPSIETISEMEFESIVEALQKKTASARELSIKQSRAICSDLPGVVRTLERLGLLPVNSSGFLRAALPKFVNNPEA